MASNSFDNKLVNFTIPQPQPSFKFAEKFSSFIAPRTLQMQQLLKDTTLTSVHEEHLQLIEKAVCGNHGDEFLARILFFSLKLQDVSQHLRLIDAVIEANPVLFDDVFSRLITPEYLPRFVDAPNFVSFLTRVTSKTLQDLNEKLNDTLLLASSSSSEHNDFLDASLEVVQTLIKTNQISGMLLSTAIFADYDLGEMQEKAERMFNVFQENEMQQALNLV